MSRYMYLAILTKNKIGATWNIAQYLFLTIDRDK